MSKASRDKGQRGELDVCRLIYEHTGWHAKRRVRQHDGDSDIEGVPGWSVEVKNHASATLGDVRKWWEQATSQAGKLRPLLAYKRQRGEWRFVWTEHLPAVGCESLYEYTVEGSIEAWAMVAREGV